MSRIVMMIKVLLAMITLTQTFSKFYLAIAIVSYVLAIRVLLQMLLEREIQNVC